MKTTTLCLLRSLFVIALAGMSAPAVASDAAKELLADYEKPDVIQMLLHHCAGEITINKPFPKRVFGRPPAEKVDARTLGHDMERCGFSAEEAREWFTKRNAKIISRDGRKVVRNNSTGVSSASASSGKSLQRRLRDLEERNYGRKLREEQRKAEGRAQVASQRSLEEVQSETRDEACQLSRKLHRWARDNASAATTVKEREQRQAKVDEMQEKIYTHCD